MSKFDPVELWISNVAYSHSKSIETEEHYKRFLKKFCGFIERTPQQILDEYEETNDRQFKRRYSQLLKAYISHLMSQDYTVGSVRGMCAAVKSFFKYSDLPLGFVPLGANKIVYHNRDITKDEIKEILRVSAPRDRAAFCMMAQSGLRPDTIRKLKLKHINPEFKKHIVPCKIVVPEEITKGMFGSYFSFMGEESVRHLKAYLDKRRHKLGPEDYLFTSKGSDNQLESRALTKVFRCTIEGLKSKGLISFEQKAKGKPRELRLYNLRSYFRNRAAKMGVEYVNFMMGHKAIYRASHIPASDAHYFSREQVETLRKLYQKEAMPNLRLESGTPDEHEKQFLEQDKTIQKQAEEIEKLKEVIGRLETQQKKIMNSLEFDPSKWNTDVTYEGHEDTLIPGTKDTNEFFEFKQLGKTIQMVIAKAKKEGKDTLTIPLTIVLNPKRKGEKRESQSES